VAHYLLGLFSVNYNTKPIMDT